MAEYVFYELALNDAFNTLISDPLFDEKEYISGDFSFKFKDYIIDSTLTNKLNIIKKYFIAAFSEVYLMQKSSSAAFNFSTAITTLKNLINLIVGANKIEIFDYSGRSINYASLTNMISKSL